MPSLAASRTLHEKFNFQVDVDGTTRLFFSKCSELSQEVAEIKYYEGGTLIPIKWPGLVTIADVTLSRGLGLDRQLHDWMLQVADLSKVGGTGSGLPPVGFGRDLTIRVRDRPRTSTLTRYRLYGAWPKKYIPGDWDNSADEVMIEQLTLAFDRFDRN